MTRRIWLDRKRDLTGVSGTGIVAEGVVFSDGTVVLRWLTEVNSTAIYPSLDAVRRIHGHDGATEILMDDAEVVDIR